MTTLFEKYGQAPDKANKQTGRLQWDIGRLSEGEQRVFSYIIYSNLKVVGKFELPPARGMYEIEGKLHEAKSNRVFFINEPKEFKGEEE